MALEIDANIIREIAKKGKRIDGRAFDAYRSVLLEPGIISNAEGSCLAKLGETQVIVGIKMEIGTPFSDTPDEGVLMCSAELVPLASPEFEGGPPGEAAIELARVVDRAIRESKSIDFKKLCIKPKEAVWTLYVDMDVLNDDGNLIDCASLAAAAALSSVKMPTVMEKDGKYTANYEKREKGLPMKGLPLSTTLVKIGNVIIADPNMHEFHALDARLTIGTIEKDGHVMVASMQKGGPDGLALDEIDKMLALAQEKSQELRKKILAAL